MRDLGKHSERTIILLPTCRSQALGPHAVGRLLVFIWDALHQFKLRSVYEGRLEEVWFSFDAKAVMSWAAVKGF